MITKWILPFLILTICFTFNNPTMAQAKMNSRTKSFVKLSKKWERQLKRAAKTEKRMAQIAPFKNSKNQKHTVGGFLKVNEDLVSKKELEALQVKIGTKTDLVWTFRVPCANLSALSKLEGILYLEIDKKVKLK